MIMTGKILVMVLVMLLQACSSRQLYETVHQNQRIQCQKVPYSEYAECMERANETYDEYTRKREESIE